MAFSRQWGGLPIILMRKENCRHWPLPGDFTKVRPDTSSPPYQILLFQPVADDKPLLSTGRTIHKFEKSGSSFPERQDLAWIRFCRHFKVRRARPS